jgi:hypothetical protein
MTLGINKKHSDNVDPNAPLRSVVGPLKTQAEASDDGDRLLHAKDKIQTPTSRPLRTKAPQARARHGMDGSTAAAPRPRRVCFRSTPVCFASPPDAYKSSAPASVTHAVVMCSLGAYTAIRVARAPQICSCHTAISYAV